MMRLALLATVVLAVLGGCRLEPRQVPAADAPADEAPMVSTSDAEVTVYLTEWCPYCRATRTYLDSIGVAYRPVDIEASEENYREYERQGGTGGIPLVVIGDTRIAGYSIPAMDEALDRVGL